MYNNIHYYSNLNTHRKLLVSKYYVLATNLVTKINLILQNIFNMVISHRIFSVAKHYLICNVLAIDLTTEINFIL